MVRSHIPVPPRAAAAAALVSTLALLAPAAAADPIAYTVRGVHLYRVDVADPFETEQVGPTGDLTVTQLAFHADGTLYGLWPAGALQLITFDLATGAGTVVAEIPLDFEDFQLQGFAGDACGRLWVSGSIEIAEETWQPALFTVDPATGSAGEPVPIGPTFPDPYWRLVGLAPYGGGRFLALGAPGLEVIDPVSAEATVLFPTGPPAVKDMDVGLDGALWTLEPIPVGSSPTVVSRMDLATGEITSPGHGLGLAGIAFAPPDGICGEAGPVPVPTLSPSMLLALAGALAAAGVAIARRRAVSRG